MADELDPVRVLRALARPGVGDELHALGVRNLTGFGPAHVYVPPDHKSYVRELIDQAFGTETPTTSVVHEAEGDELDLGGNGYTKDEIKAAVDLLDRGQLGPRSLEREAPMSYPRARRLWKWFDKRVARYDKEHKPSLYAAPGFKWVKRKTRSGERWTLVRTGSD
jgi:hypothetical protein